MLNEPTSSPVERVYLPPIPERPKAAEAHDNMRAELRAIAETVMIVRQEHYYSQQNLPPVDVLMAAMGLQPLVSFHGELNDDAEAAYQRLDALCAQHNLLPLFRQESAAPFPLFGASNARNNGAPHDPSAVGTAPAAPHVIYLMGGRYRAQAGGWILNAVLLFLTILSLLYVGMMQAVGEIGQTNPTLAQQIVDNAWWELWRGWPYALSLLLILGGHELGHYFAARYHKLSASLPFFIPMPFMIIGTMGAFIQAREPMVNRKMLFDVGAAGPLVGMVFAIPILLIGLATSGTTTLSDGSIVEGNSLLYALAKTLVFGEFLPNAAGRDVVMNQVAFAGWVGMLVTALNLMPLGTLDGGHISYSLFGRRAQLLFYPVIVAMLVFSLLDTNSGWWLWILLIFLIGRTFAVPLNDISELDARRRLLAWLTFGILLVTFVPIPLSIYGNITPPNPNPGPQPTPIFPPGDSIWWPYITAVGLVLLQKLRRR
jgi:hypothetical protein